MGNVSHPKAEILITVERGSTFQWIATITWFEGTMAFGQGETVAAAVADAVEACQLLMNAPTRRMVSDE